MNATLGGDADSGLVQTVKATEANTHDITQAHALVPSEESDVFADSNYRGVEEREAPDKDSPMRTLREKLEKTKASIRAKVAHLFRVIKRQLGFAKVK